MAKEQRLELSQVLHAIGGEDTEVYFQPPADRKMVYPCIVYERDDIDVKHANNRPYALKTRYQVTYLSYDPDSDVIDKLAALPLSKFDRHFATSNLNHDVFVIYH